MKAEIVAGALENSDEAISRTRDSHQSGSRKRAAHAGCLLSISDLRVLPTV